jgi:hypothetical protein
MEITTPVFILFISTRSKATSQFVDIEQGSGSVPNATKSTSFRINNQGGHNI